MNQLSPEEQEKILHSKPVGTFALMLVFGALMFTGWLAMYFYLFLANGPIS